MAGFDTFLKRKVSLVQLVMQKMTLCSVSVLIDKKYKVVELRPATLPARWDERREWLKMFELLATIMVSCPQRDVQSLKFHWHWMIGWFQCLGGTVRGRREVQKRKCRLVPYSVISYEHEALIDGKLESGRKQHDFAWAPRCSCFFWSAEETLFDCGTQRVAGKASSISGYGPVPYNDANIKSTKRLKTAVEHEERWIIALQKVKKLPNQR